MAGEAKACPADLYGPRCPDDCMILPGDPADEVRRFEKVEEALRDLVVSVSHGRPVKMTFCWLIEPGQAERHIPTVWWNGMSWTIRFDTRGATYFYIESHSRPAGDRFGRAVEHGFNDLDAAKLALDAQLMNDLRCAVAEEVERARLSGIARGRREMAQEALEKSRNCGGYRLRTWLESRAREKG